MRMQIRMKRLQDMYKSLGKDPNAKGKFSSEKFDRCSTSQNTKSRP